MEMDKESGKCEKSAKRESAAAEMKCGKSLRRQSDFYYYESRLMRHFYNATNAYSCIRYDTIWNELCCNRCIRVCLWLCVLITVILDAYSTV